MSISSFETDGTRTNLLLEEGKEVLCDQGPAARSLVLHLGLLCAQQVLYELSVRTRLHSCLYEMLALVTHIVIGHERYQGGAGG